MSDAGIPPPALPLAHFIKCADSARGADKTRLLTRRREGREDFGERLSFSASISIFRWVQDLPVAVFAGTNAGEDV